MGAGRRTQTILYSGTGGGGSGGNNGPPPQRNLGKSELGGVIFGCTNVTMSECLGQNLFGLPAQHIKYVQHIHEGMPLFLFNFSGRMMHGVFEAAGDGALSINPSGWTVDRTSRTQYPAQVKFRIRQKCSPLLEAAFKDAIIDNYFSATHFMFELTHHQKDRLLSLFLQNMQAPLPKSISTWSSTSGIKPGSPVKVWKKANGSSAVDVDDGWSKPKNPVTMVSNNVWQKVVPPESGKVIVAEKEESDKHQQCSSTDENVSESSEEFLFDYSQSHPNTIGAMASLGTMEDGCHSHLEVDRPQPDRAGDVASGSIDSLVLKDGQDGTGPTDEDVRSELDKAARQRNILEKLQRLDPSRADVQHAQSTELSGGGVSNSYPNGIFHGVPDAGDRVTVAVTPINMAAEWERQARERSLKEQALLKEERDKLWATVCAVDTSVATAFRKSLEISAAAIAQIRQDGIELHHLMIEARARTNQQHEQQKTFENLVTANALLESSQITMAADIKTLRLEVSELNLQFARLSTRRWEDDDVSEKSVQVTNQAGPSVVSTRQIPPQRELYILGGLADTWLQSVVVYSPTTNKVRAAASMLAPRSYAASSLLDGHIYLYGGGDGASWSDTVERYNVNRDEWEACAPMSLKRGSLGGATVGSRIYALGGGNGFIHFDDVECYDPVLGAWIPSTKMLEKRFCVAAAELDGAIYALGGFDGGNYLKTVERFDPREALWTRIPPMRIKRGSLSAAVVNGKLYALGGFDGKIFHNTVEIYDPRGQAWMPGPPMNSKRAYGAAAVLDDELYIIGGMEDMAQSLGTSNMKDRPVKQAKSWQKRVEEILKDLNLDPQVLTLLDKSDLETVVSKAMSVTGKLSDENEVRQKTSLNLFPVCDMGEDIMDDLKGLPTLGTGLKFKLRAGSLPLNSKQKQRGKGECNCPLCGQPEDNIHFLIHCPGYSHQRDALLKSIKGIVPVPMFTNFESLEAEPKAQALLGPSYWANHTQQIDACVKGFLEDIWKTRINVLYQGESYYRPQPLTEIEHYTEATGWQAVVFEPMKNRSFVAAAVL